MDIRHLLYLVVSTWLLLEVDSHPGQEPIESRILSGGERLSTALASLVNATRAKGDVHSAYSTMLFHRSKMNEYQCRNFLAEEILYGLSEGSAQGRLGFPASSSRSKQRLSSDLFSDQGSSNYKDWLTKTTLLDDIYRHYGGDHYNSNDDGSDAMEMETGDVTGYAVQDSSKSSAFLPPPGMGVSVWDGSSSSDDGVFFPGPSGGGVPLGPGAGPSGPPLWGPSSGGVATSGGHGGYYEYEEKWPPSHGHSSGKHLALKDLFDLALTALAFLAFGLFIMHLILTCMLGNQGTAVVVTSTATATAPAIKRHKRSSPERSQLLNEMAFRVITSIDRLMEVREEGGSRQATVCLHHSLCDNNKFSRDLDQGHKLWLPLSSFGISWISGYLGGNKLENLRAAILGLGNASCDSLYPSCSA